MLEFVHGAALKSLSGSWGTREALFVVAAIGWRQSVIRFAFSHYLLGIVMGKRYGIRDTLGTGPVDVTVYHGLGSGLTLRG